MDNNSSNVTFCSPPTETTVHFDNLLVAIYLLVILTSILGNMLVIIIVYKNQSMRTFTNLLICNCAFADLVKMISAIFDVLELLSRGTWYLGLLLCIFWYVCVNMSLAVTSISLTVMSLDRYFAIVLPFKKKFTKQMLYVITPTIWVIAFVFASPAVFILRSVRSVEKGPIYLQLWPPHSEQIANYKYYTVIMCVFLYALPLSIMAVIYSLTKKRLYRVSKPRNSIIRLSVRDRSDCKGDVYKLSTQLTHTDDKEIGKTTRAESRASRSFHKERLVKMLIAIVLVYAITWFPVFFMQIVLSFDSNIMQCASTLPMWAFVLTFFMQYVNSAINPLVYLGYSTSFRKGLKKLFRLSTSRSESTSRRTRSHDNRRYSSRRC